MAVGKMAHNEVLPTIDKIVSRLVEEDFAEFGKIISKFETQVVPQGHNEIVYTCLSDLEHEAQTFPKTAPGPLGGPDEITCQTVEITQESLKIDKKCVVAFQYDPCDLYQSFLNWEGIYAEKVRQSFIRAIEMDMLATLSAEVDPANVLAATVAGELTETDLLCMITALRKKNIPEDACFIVNPEDYKNISVLPCFLKADASGSRQVLGTGNLGSVFGKQIIWDNAQPAGEILLAHRTSLILGRQAGVTVLRADEPKKACKVMSWQTAYGLRVGKRGCRAVKLTL